MLNNEVISSHKTEKVDDSLLSVYWIFKWNCALQHSYLHVSQFHHSNAFRKKIDFIKSAISKDAFYQPDSAEWTIFVIAWFSHSLLCKKKRRLFCVVTQTHNQIFTQDSMHESLLKTIIRGSENERQKKTVFMACCLVHCSSFLLCTCRVLLS